jgi:RHS repeat-associated protein
VKRIGILLVSLLYTAIGLLAQSAPATQINSNNDTGLRPHTPYSTGAGNVNLTNGNLSLEIPLISLPGRAGNTYNLSLQYDSKNWVPHYTINGPIDITYQWQIEKRDVQTGDLGWHLSTPTVTVGSWRTDENGNHIGDNPDVVTLPDGSKHAIGDKIYSNRSLDSEDGSFLAIDNYASDFTVRTRSGVAYHFPDEYSAVSSISDSNGNVWYPYQDTLGRSVTFASGGTNVTLLHFYDSNGVQQTITLTVTPTTLFSTTSGDPHQTSNPPFAHPHASHGFNNVWVSQPSMNGTYNLLTSVTLQDGQHYDFEYNGYGELTKITFPTGGYAQYAYTAQVHAENLWDPLGAMAADFREVSSKTICDGAGLCGTTTYTPSLGTSEQNNDSMDEVDAYGTTNAHLTRHVFGQSSISGSSCDKYFGPREQSRSMYAGSTDSTQLLRTITTEYNSYACGNQYLPTRVTTYLYDTGGTALVSKEEFDYDTYTAHVAAPLGGDPSAQSMQDISVAIDNVIAHREYDYGSGSPVRTTTTDWLKGASYVARNDHILDRKTRVQVSGSSGYSDTKYEYDNYTEGLTDPGAVVNHGAVATPRGNLTAVQRWLNTSSSYLETRFQYENTGNAIKAVDPLGHPTWMYFDDSWGNTACIPAYSSRAYLTKVKNALNHETRATYNSCTGTMASVTDPNSQTTSFAYDLLSRITDVGYPDQGHVTVSYPNPNSVQRQQLMCLAPASACPSSSIWNTMYSYLDGLGRIKQTETVDPEGDVFVDTTYDAEGRVSTVSNPHRSSSSPTDGTTTNVYDALGRVITVIQPDDTSSVQQRIQTSYSGNCTTVIDETGRQRKSCSDALGRLTSVIEPNKDTGSLTSEFYPTYYTYDAVGNLLSVNQQGDNSSLARNRSFTYDSLSRLLTANNPESGTINYSYDNDGLLRQKIDPRGTTTFSYDVLHRLLEKDFSDGTTPSAYYDYDSATGWLLEKPIGRLVRTRFASGVNTAIYSYDPMGRVKLEYTNRASNAGTGWFEIDAQYDAAGHPTSLTYPSGRTIANQYTSAGRLLNVTTGAYPYWTAFQGTTPDTWGYIPSGALTRSWVGNGTPSGSNFNNRLQPTVFWAYPMSTLSVLREVKYYDGSGHNNGNVMSVDDYLNGNGTQTFAYDNLNRITAATQTNTWSQMFTPDAWGNLQQSGSMNFVQSFGANNRISSGGYLYDLAGNLTHDPTPGATHDYVYDAESRIRTVDTTGATYTYDADGNRIRKDVGSDATEYVYFGGQVIAEHKLNGDWSDYIYANGKRIAKADTFQDVMHTHGNRNCSGCGAQFVGFSLSGGGGYAGYVIQTDDRLMFRQWQGSGTVSGMGISFVGGGSASDLHDQDNQPMAGDTYQQVWHSRKFVLSSFAGSAIDGIYAFTGDGTQPGLWDIYYADIVIVSADGTVRPIYTGQSTVSLSPWATSGMVDLSSGVVHQPGLAPIASLTTRYYHGDHLGTSRLMTNGYGYPIWQGTFLPFGQEWNAQATTNHYKFTGKERDSETGLDYFGARYYGSSMGRWMSPDWAAKATAVPYADFGDPQTLNLYGYVRNNPLSKNDPDGHFGCGFLWLGNCKPKVDPKQPLPPTPPTPKPPELPGRQPDGSYKASPGQIAEIRAADKNGTTITTKDDPKGQCVTACERFTGVPGPTSSWRQGNAATDLTDKDKGIAIATFGPDGRYPTSGARNSAVFMGTSVGGIWVADQWPEQKPVTIWFMPTNNLNNPDNPSMNASAYSVIVVPKP